MDLVSNLMPLNTCNFRVILDKKDENFMLKIVFYTECNVNSA